MPAPGSCVYCTRPLTSVLVCEACKRVQPLPADADAFAVLGVPRRLGQESAALEARFHALSRLLHPDRFHGSPEIDRARSLSNSSALTRAYRTLRDPIARGRYWLDLGGAGLGDDQKIVPPELAAAVFEIQERIEEAGEATEPAEKQEARRSLREIRDGLKEQAADHVRNLEALYSSVSEAPPEDAGLRARLQNALSAYNYLNRQIVNVDSALDGL